MENEERNRFSSYTLGEGRTGIGQLVEFTCPTEPGVAEQVREFLRTNVRTIDVPTTGRVNIAHGGYGQYTRYDIVQHDYVGGGPGEDGSWGYIEVLEIKNPPGGRWGIILNERTSGHGSIFTEWETVENARAAFAKYWGRREKFLELLGFKRQVACGALTPWFYAIGDEELVGDYTFPYGLQDDPVFRFGRQFIVFDGDGVPTVKACMGTRFITYEVPNRDSYGQSRFHHRHVYWDDGTFWDESNDRVCPPRPLEEGELWITEVIRQFRQALAGKITDFTINFTDGNKFIGKINKGNRRVSVCPEGDYLLEVHLKLKNGGRQKITELGWVIGFKPTPDAPDVIRYVSQSYARMGKEVEGIEIKKCRKTKGGKKWAGVFFNRLRQ